MSDDIDELRAMVDRLYKDLDAATANARQAAKDIGRLAIEASEATIARDAALARADVAEAEVARLRRKPNGDLYEAASAARAIVDEGARAEAAERALAALRGEAAGAVRTGRALIGGLPRDDSAGEPDVFLLRHEEALDDLAARLEQAP